MKYLKFSPFYLISLLPLTFLYVISDFTFFLMYNVLKYRRKVVRQNLENAFPKKNLSEIIHIEKGFYKHFCDVIFEAIKTLTITKKEVINRFAVKNNDLIDQFYNEKRDIIMYGAHFSNWEWASFLPLFQSHQLTSFYQKLSNGYFDELMQQIRGRFGLICIESQKGYKTLNLLKQKNILTLNLIIGDQKPQINSSKYWTTFLNQDTAFLIGADKIAKKMNQVVVFPEYKKLKRGKYELNFILLEENSQGNKDEEIIEKYIRVLENLIIKNPELWLWSHRRWKLKKPQE